MDIAAHRGLAPIAEYQDEAISGAAGRDKRPGFDRMMRDAGRRRFDVLLVWHVDRLGRSTSTVALALDDLHAAGVNYVDNNGLDTTTPTGKAMFGMSAVFAELERSLIRERVLAGLERARRQGKRLGRPRNQPEGRGGHPRPPEGWASGQEGGQGPRRGERHSVARQAGDGALSDMARYRWGTAVVRSGA
jgi:DNA invertase Pin-like site-specific DNA recombinase